MPVKLFSGVYCVIIGAARYGGCSKLPTGAGLATITV